MHILAPAKVGGLETVVRHLCRGLARAGNHVLVASTVSEEDGGQELDQPASYAGVERRAIAVSSRGYRAERRAVEGLIRSWRPHVVHTHGYRPDVIDAPVARKLGLPIVTTVHGFTGNGWKNRLYEAIQRRAFRRFDAVVAVSKPLGRELEAVGVDPPRIHVVPNAWEPEEEWLNRGEARERLGLPMEDAVVGWVGRLTPEKGPDLMLEATSLLRDPPFRLVMVGGGRMESDLRQQAERDGIAPRLTWAGILPHAARYMRGFDLLALTSRTEGTPMVLLEAMAAGVPIVARSVGGIGDLLNEDEAFLVSAPGASAVASALELALGDRAEASCRAARARDRFTRDHAVDPWVEQYLHIYRSLPL